MCNNVSRALVTQARPAQPARPPSPPVVSRVVQNHPFVQERNASSAKPQPGPDRFGWMNAPRFNGGQR